LGASVESDAKLETYSGSVEEDITEEIILERANGVLKFGEQEDVPSFDQTLLTRDGGCTVERMAEEYEIPTERRAKQLIGFAVRKNELTWAHILIEEVCEAIGACNGSVEDLRTELIQVAAVAMGWIEMLDNGVVTK
jgi:hypothetical protein